MILTGEWPDVYGNLMVDWGEEYQTYEPAAKQLVKFQSTSKKTGKASSSSFFGIAPDKDEGQPFAEEDPQQDYAITWEQAAIGTGVTLTEDMFLYDETDNMSEKIRELARSAQLRIEHDITMRFRYAGSTSFTNISNKSVSIACADTKALVADDHPIPNSSAVNDNDMDTLGFGKESLVLALNKFRSFRNPKGLKVTGLKPTHIVTSDDEEMRDMVERVLKTPKGIGDGNGDINPMASRGLQHLQLPYLTTDGDGTISTTARFYWFLVCMPQVDLHMKQAQEISARFPAELGRGDPNLPITGDHKVTVRGTYGLYTRRPIWCVGSLATALGA